MNPVKHQYFGDVNDYRKYGLLRCIAEATGFGVGMLWLLTADDGRSDGEFRRYLCEPQRWRHHDPSLHDRLARLLEPEVVRHVEHAATWELIPGARYFNARVPDNSAARQRYFSAAVDALAPCPLLFLDPDNGVEVQSVRYGAKNSSKYVYWRELSALFARGHSLLVYQHYPRIARSVFEAKLVEQMRSNLGAPEVTVFSTAHVGFFLALQDRHVLALPAIIAAVEERWSGQLWGHR